MPYFACSLSLHIASVERLRFPAFIYLAAVIKGFPGGHIVMKVAGLAYIAEASAPDIRSFYFGLVLVTSVAAHALGSLVSGGLIMHKHFTANFAVGICTWVIYLLYLVLVLREPERHTIPDGTLNNGSSDDSVTPQESNTSRWTPSMIRVGLKRFAKAVIQPLAFIMADPTLALLGIMEFLIMLALGAFIVIIVWSDYMFGLTPMEVRLPYMPWLIKGVDSHAWQAGHVWAIISVSRAFSLLCIVPTLKAVYHYMSTKQSIQLDIRPSEPLNIGPQPLATEVVQAAEPSEGTWPMDDTGTAEALLAQNLHKASAAQELFICRVCLLSDAIGMILVSLSRSSVQVSIGAIFVLAIRG